MKKKQSQKKQTEKPKGKCMILKGSPHDSQCGDEPDVIVKLDYYPATFVYTFEDGTKKVYTPKPEDEQRIPTPMYWEYMNQMNEKLKKEGGAGATFTVYQLHVDGEKME